MKVQAAKVKVGDHLVFHETEYTVVEVTPVCEYGGLAIAIAFEGTNEGHAYLYEAAQELEMAS
jgi:hypothetical protein